MAGDEEKIIVILQGPTASGKTDLRDETLKKSDIIKSVFNEGITYPDPDKRVVYFGIDEKVEDNKEYRKEVAKVVKEYKGKVPEILTAFTDRVENPEEVGDPKGFLPGFIKRVDNIYNNFRENKYEKEYETVIKDFFEAPEKRVLIIETTGKKPPEKYLNAIPEAKKIRIIISHSIVNIVNLKQRNFSRARGALSELIKYIKNKDARDNVSLLIKFMEDTQTSENFPQLISFIKNNVPREKIAELIAYLNNINKGNFEEDLTNLTTLNTKLESLGTIDLKLSRPQSQLGLLELKKESLDKDARDNVSLLIRFLEDISLAGRYRSNLLKLKTRLEDELPRPSGPYEDPGPPPFRIPSKSVLSFNDFKETVNNIVSNLKVLDNDCVENNPDKPCKWTTERFAGSDIEFMIFDNNEKMKLVGRSIKLTGDRRTTTHNPAVSRERIYELSGLQLPDSTQFGKVLQRAVKRSSAQKVSKQLGAFGKLHPKYNKKCKEYIKFVKSYV